MAERRAFRHRSSTVCVLLSAEPAIGAVAGPALLQEQLSSL
nr:hypothetical protein [Brevundimonas subvibrioides]